MRVRLAMQVKHGGAPFAQMALGLLPFTKDAVLARACGEWQTARAVNHVLPVFLRLAERNVLVVGAGSVGTRKITELVEVGARVTVVAREASAQVQALHEQDSVRLELREFVPSDTDGKWLVISATNDRTVNAAVAAACDERRIFVCSVDDPPNASMFFGSVIRRDPFLIAISSRGELPALTRLLREVIERSLPDAHWIRNARELRRQWKADKVPMADRFQDLVRRIAESDRNRD